MVRIVAAIGVLLAASGCWERTCLRGDCAAASACDRVTFACGGDATLYVGRFDDADPATYLVHGDGAGADVLLSNGEVTVVLAALEAPRDLAPTGGNVIDLGPAGGADDVNLIYQIAGVLPDDAFAYDTLELEDRAPEYVAAVARGHLDGRPEIRVVTRYELRPCDPGVRVRSELFNDSPDVQAYVLADVPHWGERRVVPFAPRDGQGYLAPTLDIFELTSVYLPVDYTAGAAPALESPGYAVAVCNQVQLTGLNDLAISAFGTPIQLVRPGESILLERFWTTAGSGQGPAVAIDVALGIRGQLADDALFDVRGTIMAGGLAFGGDVRRASVILSSADGDVVTPLTAVVPDGDGRFAVTVPLRAGLRYEVASFGRVVATGDVPDDGEIGAIAIAAPATLQVVVDDGAAAMAAQVVLIPSDDATRAATRGSFHGRFDECAPWLGPPHGGSPACNRFLVDLVGAEVEVPAGSYDVYATTGPDYTLGRQAGVTLVEGEITSLAFTLTRLDVVPSGWLRADLHVHGRASYDSAIPDLDRVRSFVAAGIEVIAATDHDYVTDYAEAIEALGVEDRVRVMGGVETSQQIPWMRVAGVDLPRVIGHFNFWPMTPVPWAPRGGAPWDEVMEPGQLFDRMAPVIGPDGVIMLNHPLGAQQAGRDIGYLTAIDFDPRQTIPDQPDGSHNGVLTRVPGSTRRNLDWDVIEVQNGQGITELQKTEPAWWSLLSQGFVVAGIANSDSHGLNDAYLGWPRTLVFTGGDLASFDEVTLDRAVKDGKTSAGIGITILVSIESAGGALVRGPGLAPYTPGAGDVLVIEVRAAPWIPVTAVWAHTSEGEVTIASGSQLATPPDPLGASGVVRIVLRTPLDELVAGRDDWFVIEAGMPLPPSVDLDDDGLPDTGDNDADGDADADDVWPDRETGPLHEPKDPTDDADPRYLLTRVVPKAWPIGFTSPFLIDVAGDGWEPPGL